MKVVSVISQKGGAGKTTLALHLAVASSTAGRNTAVLDLDPQASAANWADRRAAELPVVRSAHASRLQHELRQIQQAGGELVMIDTAPHADRTALETAKASDLVLVPCRPSILDLEAMTSTLDLIRTTGTPLWAVLNAVAPYGAETAEAAAAMVALDVVVCPVRIGRRVVFARALVSGLTAQEVEPKGKAAAEIGQLYALVAAHVGDPQRGTHG